VYIKAESSDHFQIVDMWDRIRDGVCKAQRFKAGFLQHSVADGVRDGLIEVCLAPNAADPASPTIEKEILVALTRVCRLETGLPAGFCLVRGDASSHENALQRRTQARNEPVREEEQPVVSDAAPDSLDEREWTQNPKVRLVLDVFSGTLEHVRKTKNATPE
jgi:hypothetical protein